jgi:hypothetical protein
MFTDKSIGHSKLENLPNSYHDNEVDAEVIDL